MRTVTLAEKARTRLRALRLGRGEDRSGGREKASILVSIYGRRCTGPSSASGPLTLGLSHGARGGEATPQTTKGRPAVAGRPFGSGTDRGAQFDAEIMWAMVKNSSVRPVFAPWLKYQPCSPGYFELGRAARVAWLSCMSAIVMLWVNGITES